MSDSDFYSFEKAIQKLELEEEDLKRLISAGEIRAFRDGSKMRLRAEDVQRVAQDMGIGSEVGEEDAGEVLEVEEVLFSESAEDEGMVTTQLSEEDTLLEDDVEEVVVIEEGSDTETERSAAPVPSGRSRAAAPAPEASTPAGIMIATVATFAILLYGLAFAVGALTSTSTGLTDGIVKMFVG